MTTSISSGDRPAGCPTDERWHRAAGAGAETATERIGMQTAPRGYDRNLTGDNHWAAGTVDALTPNADQMVMASAADAVANFETSHIKLPRLPTAVQFWRVCWSRTWRANFREAAGTYARPRTLEAWRAVLAFRKNADRLRQKSAIIQITTFILLLVAGGGIAAVDFASPWPAIAVSTSLVMALLTITLAVPVEKLLTEIGDRNKELTKGKTTNEIELEEAVAEMAVVMLKPQACAQFTALWAALKTSSERSGVPLLRGDLSWAILRAQTDPASEN